MTKTNITLKNGKEISVNMDADSKIAALVKTATNGIASWAAYAAQRGTSLDGLDAPWFNAWTNRCGFTVSDAAPKDSTPAPAPVSNEQRYWDLVKQAKAIEAELEALKPGVIATLQNADDMTMAVNGGAMKLTIAKASTEYSNDAFDVLTPDQIKLVAKIQKGKLDALKLPVDLTPYEIPGRPATNRITCI
jgi:hypothetical protein